MTHSPNKPSGPLSGPECQVQTLISQAREAIRSDESLEHFKARVEKETGFPFDVIPVGDSTDLLGSAIFCKCGNVFVVGVGYPEKNETTGEETFREFRIIDLSGQERP
jgi:hypothetical protein